MLTIKEIYEIAKQNDIRVTRHWASTSEGEEPPKLKSLSLYFFKEAPLAWATLMSNLSEVPCSLSGTRQMTGSGATDGAFYPCYEALLPEVNRKRAEIGLARTY